MKGYYLCPKCYKLHDGKKATVESLMEGEGLFGCDCGFRIHADNAIPNSYASELKLTCENIYKQCKDIDKSNTREILKLMKTSDIQWDVTKLDKYINKCERILEKYEANNYADDREAYDEFQNSMDLSWDECNAFVSAFSQYINTDRKLVVITAASYLELIFNEYQRIVLKSILPEHGAIRFLKSNERNGIARSLESIDWFLEKPFAEKCNEIEKGFFDKWTDLRNIRNEIIHSNSKFISKVKLSNIMKLIDTSTYIFAKLTQEICRDRGIYFS